METDKKRPSLNGEQRTAAFCAENAVVAAGAGSGKTMVLAHRFAWLITEKKLSIDEILTLTFTRKAAAQMYRRIHELLREIAAENSGVEGERAKNALDNFTRARIQTLDSYCAALVKQSAPRYGLSPDFAVDEERCHRLAFDESLPFLISRRHHPAIERLYAQYSPENIVNVIFAKTIFNFSRIEEEISFSAGIQKQFDAACNEWQIQREKINQQLNKMADMIFENGALLPALAPLMSRFRNGEIVFPARADIRAYFDTLLKMSPDAVVDGAETHPVYESVMAVFNFVDNIKKLKLTAGTPRNNNPAKDAVLEIRALFTEFSSLAVFCLQAGLLVSLMSLLDNLQHRYIGKKRAEAVLTFADIARLAKTILIEQANIRQGEKDAFKAIMIDEFQDNNELQKDLLFLLAEKNEMLNQGVPPATDLVDGKLFFVGDEKQSVYRFRGADVSVFRKLKDELRCGDLPLHINYRSAPHLIGAFNTIFGGSVFDPQGQQFLPKHPAVFVTGSALPPYEAAYTALRAGTSGAGKLSLCIFDSKKVPGGGTAKEDSDSEVGATGGITEETDDALSSVENEAHFVAERIQQLLDETDENGGAKYQPNDIAILLRSRTNQRLFEKHLRLLNIPYASENLNGFFADGSVNDIMSVLRLLAYPMDRAAYAEMLRSPFAGLSLPGLAVCLAGFNGSEETEIFGEETLLFLSAEDQRKYRQGRNIYNTIREKATTENVSSLVSELWYGQGYRYETEWNPQTRVYAELYDYLFHLAAKVDAEGEGLAAFTDLILSLRDSDARLDDIEIPLERPGAVHLTTVHKSKGLEFPVVFLACCGNHSRQNSGEVLFDAGELGLAFNPPLPPRCRQAEDIKRNFLWERFFAEKKMQEIAELRRLLYVGMTRAENELYLSGCLDIGSVGDDSNNFPMQVKQYIDKKIVEKNEKNPGGKGISGDSILDNDTFFGLCLPVFMAHLPPEGLAAGSGTPLFFSLEKISACVDDYLRGTRGRGAVLPNDQNGLNAFIEKTEPFYLNAAVVETPLPRNNHFTPTSLGQQLDGFPYENGSVGGKTGESKPREQFSANAEFSGIDSTDIFNKVDLLLNRYMEHENDSAGKFNSGGFGTIAHVCVEALLSGKEAVIPPELAALLDPGKADAFLAAGKKLAARFMRSPLGKIARKDKFRKNEYPFRSILRNSDGNEFFVNGTIDLLFEDAETIHVVDFKTDSKEMPAQHSAQMACYYRAASELFAGPANKKCRIWLYYLRSGHAVEMTENAKTRNLERFISD